MRIKGLKSALPLCMALAIAIASLGSLCIQRSAWASTGTIEIVATGEAHDYNAYRLFSCNVEGDDEVSSVSTSGCMPSGFYAAAFTETNPQRMAEELLKSLKGSDASTYVAKLSLKAVPYETQADPTTITTGEVASLSSGVYLLVSHDAQPILAAVGGNPVTVSEKSTVPSVTKQVSVADGEWTDAVDASIGDAVSFRIAGTLPSNYGAFDSYSYAFADELSEGLEADEGSVELTLLAADGTESTIASGYSVDLDGTSLAVSFEDLKASAPDAQAGDQIVLTYSATLDGDAALGFEVGNPNTVTLKYRRSPSYDEQGETKPAKAVVYTFGIAISKVASGTGKALSGATFALIGPDGEEVARATSGTDGELSFAGLAAGGYTLHEVEAPKGYDAVADVDVSISADLESKSLTGSVESASAKVTSVDAQAGEVAVQVADPVSSSDSPSSDDASGSSSKKSGGLFPKTSDAMLALAGAAMIIGSVALIVVRRNSRRKEESR